MEAFLDVVRRAAAEVLADRPGRVLEIGPGTGQWLLELAGRRRVESIVTVDVVPPHLIPEAEALAPRKAVADGRRLPFQGRTFDTVVCVNVASILPYGGLRRILREMGRVLRPGGRGVVTVQNRAHPVLYARMDRQPRRYRSAEIPFSYRGSDVLRWIRDAGGRKAVIHPQSFGVPRYGKGKICGAFQVLMTGAHHQLINRHRPLSPVLMFSWDACKSI